MYHISMPKRFILTIPITPVERGRVTIMKDSNVEGCKSDAEFVRLLLCREWNRRYRLGKPKASEWQTAFRKGRPAKDKLACTGQQEAASLPHG